MGINKFIFTGLFLLFASFCVGQEKQPPTAADSVKTAVNKEGVVVDSLFTSKKVINPLGPSRAAFLSAAIPGLGQIYNKKYWKVPIVWGAIGAGIYGYTFYDKEYKDLRQAFKRRRAGFTDDKFYDLRLQPGEVTTRTTPEIDNQRLERLQNDRQNDRDLTLLVTILLYALNVVDANVDAHLKQFNVDDKLGLDMTIKPYLDITPISYDPNYGMALIVKF